MPYLVLLGICMVLLEKQHDFGTAVLLALVTILLLFLAGIKLTYFLVPFSVLIPVFIFLVESASYRMKRITAFLNPWDDPQGAGFQLIQSLIAVGNGGPFGVGLSNSSQKLFYLPAPHTDFIFAIIAEELDWPGREHSYFCLGCLSSGLQDRLRGQPERRRDVYGSSGFRHHGIDRFPGPGQSGSRDGAFANQGNTLTAYFLRRIFHGFYVDFDWASFQYFARAQDVVAAEV